MYAIFWRYAGVERVKKGGKVQPFLLVKFIFLLQRQALPWLLCRRLLF